MFSCFILNFIFSLNILVNYFFSNFIHLVIKFKQTIYMKDTSDETFFDETFEFTEDDMAVVGKYSKDEILIQIQKYEEYHREYV